MKWIAFDYGGQAYSLGDCGDYDMAEEIADEYLVSDKLGNGWMFILSTADLKEILEKVESEEASSQ